MNTCTQILAMVYQLIFTGAAAADMGLRRSSVLETYIKDFLQIEPDEDDLRNEGTLYKRLFGNECRSLVERVYLEIMSNMKGRSYAEVEDQLCALSIVQHIAATALWKHRCDVGEMLESFARDFDRFDVQSERERLHARANAT